jgi:hypothetical protein
MHANESCFFLCLLSVAEEERKRMDWAVPKVDFLDAVRTCMNKGWLKNDFTVTNDCKILEYLTGEKVTKEVVQDVGVVKSNQYTVEKWIWGDRTHFRRRGWDVYRNSQTVKNGYRMCTYKYTHI